MTIQLLEVFKISIIILILTLSWLSIQIGRYLFRKLRLQKSINDINYRLDQTEYELLDKFITDAFNEYLVFNISFQEDMYINTDMEKKMISEVSMQVLKNISPVMIGKISLYYNIDSLEDIIANKVYMLVSDYTIENNTIKQD